MNELNRKLFRELWRMKGQAIAVCLVIASGMALFVMSFSALKSLTLSQTTYYERNRFAHVFAHLKRAPNSLAWRDSVVAGETLLATIQPKAAEMLDARALAEAEARVRMAETALSQARPQVERAMAELDFAESDLGRVRELKKSSITQQDLEEAEMRYRTETQDLRSASLAEQIARYELEMAKAALIRTREESGEDYPNQRFEIRSPIDGRVLRVMQESATVAAAGAPLLEIGDPQDLEVEVDVLSSDAVKVEPGAPVILEQWGGEKPLRGAVRLVEPQGFTKVSALGIEEQRVNVIVDFVDPPKRRSSLGDGYRVEARIVIWQRDEAMKVPISALFRHEQDWAVFVIKDGRAELRVVEIGRRSEFEAEVLDGLAEGERVVMHASDQITAGVAVAPRNLETLER